METGEIILLGVLVGFFLIALLIAIINITFLSIRIYFIGYCQRTDPYFEVLIKNTLDRIAAREEIDVFYVPFEELNPDVRDKNDGACGKYIHYNKNLKTDTLRWIIKKQALYEHMIKIERKHGIPYSLYYKTKYGEDINIKTYEFCVPRIMIAELEDSKRKSIYHRLWGLKTYAHELGHHIAWRDESDGSEERADEIAADLLLDNLPKYCILLFNFLFEKSKRYEEPKGKKYWRLAWQFYREFYRKRKKLNEESKLLT